MQDGRGSGSKTMGRGPCFGEWRSDWSVNKKYIINLSDTKRCKEHVTSLKRKKKCEEISLKWEVWTLCQYIKIRIDRKSTHKIMDVKTAGSCFGANFILNKMVKNTTTLGRGLHYLLPPSCWNAFAFSIFSHCTDD